MASSVDTSPRLSLSPPYRTAGALGSWAPVMIDELEEAFLQAKANSDATQEFLDLAMFMGDSDVDEDISLDGGHLRIAQERQAAEQASRESPSDAARCHPSPDFPPFQEEAAWNVQRGKGASRHPATQ